MRRLWLAAALLAGCDGSAPAPEPPPPAIPPVGEARLVRAKIPAEEFGPTAAPDAAPALRWDIAEKRVHRYDARRALWVEGWQAKAGGEPARARHHVQEEGPVAVAGKGAHGVAILKLRKVLWERDGKPETAETLKEQPVSDGEADLDPQGRLSRRRRLSGDLNWQLPALILALPERALAPGDTAQTDVDVPPTRESEGYKGSVTTRLARWERIGPRECARLEDEFELDFLPPVGEEGAGRLRGRIVRHFCPAEGRLARADLAVAFAYRKRFKVADADERVTWYVESHDTESTVTLRLRD